MKTNSIRFEVNGSSVTVFGIPELEGCKGGFVGGGVASFRKEGHEWYLVNAEAGKWRKMKAHGHLILDDSEVDYESVKANCRNGLYNAETKSIRYADVWLYDGRFENGLSAISWMIYPDGMYFADSDGFGMEDNDEENLYAIIDSNLDIVEPFRPIRDIDAYLKKLRSSAQPVRSQRIFNLIITDESGSMSWIMKEAIDSVNETLQTIAAAQKKHEDQEHFVTLVTFNDEVNTICECAPIGEVSELNAETYRPQCCTALYDAMGMSLTALRQKVKDGDKVLVTVVTDGCENASKEYKGNAIKALVDELKSQGWVFAYIGANQDVEAVAAQISITNVMKFVTTSEGTMKMSRKVSSSRERLFDSIADCCFCADEANRNFFDEED